MDSTKTCKRCGCVQSLEDFHRDKSLKGGRSNTCKKCYEETQGPARREGARAWRLRNIEYARLRDRERRLTEPRRQQTKECADRRRARKREEDRSYRISNWPRCYATVRAWILRHPEKQKEYKRRYYESHRQQWRDRDRIKRERILSELLYEQQGLCAYCHDPLEGKRIHIDHRIPLSRGGTNDRQNLSASCASCNLKKYTKTADEFLPIGDASF